MKGFLAAAVGSLLAFSANAASYSGTGSILITNIGSTYNVGDTVTWSFTTGAPVTTPYVDSTVITAFSVSVGGQSWTLADYFPYFPAPAFSAVSGGSLEVFYTGLNSNNAFLATGLQLLSPSPMAPETFFYVSNPVAVFDPDSIDLDALGVLGGPPAPPPPAVPEPASWAMLIAGFGLAGAVARRRRMIATA